MSLPTNPLNRKEQYLNAIATGNTVDMPAKPITREEEYLEAIAKSGGGGGGTTNYNALDNKPQIAGTTLQGNKTLADLGIAGEDAIEDVYAVMGEMGAKNLIPYPYANTTKTENNVTFTDNGDGTITIVTGTGGVTANTFFYLTSNAWRFTLHKGSYILSDTTIAEEGLGVQIYQRTSPYTNIADTILGDNLFTISEDIEVMMRITVKQGINVDNVIIKPMLRLASDTDDTYQSYAKTNKQLTDEIANKVDKVEGKGLSTNDYSDTEKGKVTANAEAIEAMVNVNGSCNILPCDATTQTIEGITWTVNADGTVTASGTATANGSVLTYHRFTSECVLNGKEVVLKGCPVGGDSSKYSISGFRVAGSSSYLDNREEYGEGVIFTWNNDSSQVAPEIQLYIAPNYAIQGTLTFKPMLYDARLTPTGYVPYTMTNRELTESTLKYVKISKSSFAWDSTNKCFYHTNPPSEVTRNKGFIVNPLNGQACMNAYYSTVSGYLFVVGWIPVSASSIDENYDFDCYILT